MGNAIENKNITFKKDTGRETVVGVISEIQINQGSYSTIFDSIVDVAGHKKRFIIKKYKDTMGASAAKNADKAFKNYSLAKKAGLKIFPTFRVSENKKNILMTTGFSNGQICVGSNNDITVTELGRPLICEIQNVDKFLSDFFNEHLKAAKHGIRFWIDVFFFILSRNEPTKIDFVVGDLDNSAEMEPSKSIGLRNMEYARTTLIAFCEKNINTNFAYKFREKVEAYYEQGVNAVNASELN